jgi:SagB-type dehydrogenase family enzyme
MNEQLRFRPGVRVAHRDDGTTRLYRDRGGISIGRLDPAIGQVLDLLAAGPCTEDELAARVPEPRLLDLHLLLQRLRAGGWLDRILTEGGEPVLTVRPVSPHPTAPVKQPTGPVRLSRFAILRTDDDGWLMESPLAHVQLRFQDPGVITTSLASAGNAVTDVLTEYGFATTGEDDFSHRMWAPHELLFHARSRAGRHDLPYGGTYWAEGIAEPPPVVRPPRGTAAVTLYRPDLDALRREDPTLTTVLEDRRSVREHDDAAPLTTRQLGEFLFRTARVRRTIWENGPAADARARAGALSSRPYPSGGACYELEIYPVVRNVYGLAAGLYHYDPVDHRLETVPVADQAALAGLSELARAASLMTAPPQVTFVIAARTGRVMWKYQSMAYALTLKHVGVLYQVMYSVATAMGLAACGLGGGDSDAFAKATGLGYLDETSVGEFVLGAPLPAAREN